jgi:predicted RNA-binding Zn-ribbon protein involved in translation (DUF1610 family)
MSTAGWDAEFFLMDRNLYIDLYRGKEFKNDEHIEVGFCPDCGESLIEGTDRMEGCEKCLEDDSELVRMDIEDGTYLAIVMWERPSHKEKPGHWYLSLEHKEIGASTCLDAEPYEISHCPFCGMKFHGE